MTALTVPQTRQSALVAIADFDASDFVTDVGKAVFALPQNAVVLGGEVTTHNVITGSSTVELEIGDSVSKARYLASVDVKSAVISSPLLVTGYRVVNATRDLLLEIDAAGTIVSGDGQILLIYAVVGRATENFE